MLAYVSKYILQHSPYKIPPQCPQHWIIHIFIWNNNDWNFSQISLYTRADTEEAKRIPSKTNDQEIIPNHIIFKLLEIKTKKSPEEAQGEQIFSYGSKSKTYCWFLKDHRRKWGKYENAKKKNSTKLKFCPMWNHPSKEKKCFQIYNDWRNPLIIDLFCKKS